LAIVKHLYHEARCKDKDENLNFSNCLKILFMPFYIPVLIVNAAGLWCGRTRVYVYF